jgi:hypothetical protein
MVVSSFVRKTYLILPKPIRLAVRFALPKRAPRAAKVAKRESALSQFEAVSKHTFDLLWKE